LAGNKNIQPFKTWYILGIFIVEFFFEVL